jgi:hypothetical protein
MKAEGIRGQRQWSFEEARFGKKTLPQNASRAKSVLISV